MGTTVIIKRGDTARKLTDTLTLDGAPLNLAGATVKAAWRQRLEKIVTVRNAAIVNAAAGMVEYQFVAGDTDLDGEFLMEWHVTLSGGGRLAFPTADYHVIRVVADLPES